MRHWTGAPAGDLKDEDVVRVEQFLKCPPSASDFTFRNLAAFRTG